MSRGCWWLIELLSEDTGNATAYWSNEEEWEPMWKLGTAGHDARQFRWKLQAEAYILWHFGRWAMPIMRATEHLWIDDDVGPWIYRGFNLLYSRG